MYTALRATSQALAAYIRQRLEADPNLGRFFDSVQGGTMIVSPSTPHEMSERPVEGLSIWLYRVVRDEERLNRPPIRLDHQRIRRPPLPVRLHYLIAPVLNSDTDIASETEQAILGKVLQLIHDHPTLRGADFPPDNDFSGTQTELNVRLETMGLEEITRVWEALEGSYQLSVSYEVSVVDIDSILEEDGTPVEVVMPEYGLIVGS
jgi:Pvc16 N-terminal domain